MLEVCIAVLAIAVMTLLYLPCTSFRNFDFYLFGDAYMEQQSTAICQRKPISWDSGNMVIGFNEKGNIHQPMTYEIDDHEIVLELGGGRLEYK